MKQLESDIKNGIFKKVYLLFGPQSYLRKRCEDLLISSLLPEGDTMNLAKFYGSKVDMHEVISLSETMPFLAERRVIVLENTLLFTKANEEFADFIENIPDSCCVIFSEEKIDSRLKQVKAVKSAGTVAEFTGLSDAELEKWMISKLSAEHRQITQKALAMFMARCGDDMWQISAELEKLISYTFSKDGIRPEDVEALMPPLPEDKIFTMIDAMLAQKKEVALKYYTDLLALRSDHLGILALIEQQFRLMLHVKKMDAEHMSQRDMAAALKMRDVRVKMALPAAKKSSKMFLTDSIKLCADREEEIKSGRIDEAVGVEMLILQLCSYSENS